MQYKIICKYNNASFSGLLCKNNKKTKQKRLVPVALQQSLSWYWIDLKCTSDSFGQSWVLWPEGVGNKQRGPLLMRQ